MENSPGEEVGGGGGICQGILKGTVRKPEIGGHNDRATAWAEQESEDLLGVWPLSLA